MADTDIVCISPIDGRELVRRPIMSETAIDAAVKAAREAQKAWRNTADCRARCEGLRLPRCAARHEPGGGARDRPADGPPGALRRRVPRGRGAGALHDRDCGEEPAADPGRRREAGLPPHDQARAGRPRARHRALELSLSHRHQHHRAGARWPAMRCCSSTPRRRCWPASASRWRWTGPACRRACSRTCISATTRRAAFSAPASSITATSPAPSPAGAPSSAQRRAPSPRSGSSSAARTRPMCARTPISTTPSRTSSTAPSSIRASAAAASSASTCTRSTTTASSRARSIS